MRRLACGAGCGVQAADSQPVVGRRGRSTRRRRPVPNATRRGNGCVGLVTKHSPSHEGLRGYLKQDGACREEAPPAHEPGVVPPPKTAAAGARRVPHKRGLPARHSPGARHPLVAPRPAGRRWTEGRNEEGSTTRSGYRWRGQRSYARCNPAGAGPQPSPAPLSQPHRHPPA